MNIPHISIGQKTFKLPTLKQISVISGVVLFAVSQLYLLLHNGTLLGYQVRHVESSSSRSKELNGDNAACRLLEVGAVGRVLGLSMMSPTSAVGDVTNPGLISSCFYRSEQTPSRSVTVMLRDSKDESTAKQQFQAPKARFKTETITDKGDEAFFVTAVNQLHVRQGKRLITITVSESVDGSDIPTKEAAHELSKVMLKK